MHACLPARTQRRRLTRSILLGIGLFAVACGRKPKPVTPVPAPPAPPAPVEAAPTVKLGVIVSQTGATPAMRQYADAILDGVRIAASEHEKTGGHRVDIAVRDDGGRAASSSAMLRDLEAAGVTAVIGPLFDAGARAAATARSSADLVLILPALTQPLGQPNTYALNREDSAGAALLGRYAASLKLRAGILHERGARASDIAAFTAAFTGRGGAAPITVSFPTGTTTFSAQIRTLKNAGIHILYLPLSARDIPQVLPQLGYYGLEGVQILGGEAWTAEGLRRNQPAGLFDGVIAATVLPRASTDVAWQTFETAYQQTYKRSLLSPIPALGYDAAQLVLRALPRGRVNGADAAKAVARAAPLKGATGILRVTNGAVSRTAFLARFSGGSWQQIDFTGAQ